MKKYRIRPGSLAWYVKEFDLCIALFLIAVALAVFVYAYEATSYRESEENVRVKEVVAEEEKALIEELAGFVPLDVPMEAELQEFVFNVADDYGLDGRLVMAVIAMESNFRTDIIGDGGAAVGLMQVQEQWHQGRMERLEVTDLADPYENVIVGVDYLAELIERGGLEWGLMAFNGGPDYANEMTERGIVTEYAESVIYLSEDL